MRDARARRAAAPERSREYEEASRELEEITTRIWKLDEDGAGQDHDVALSVARLRAVQATLATDAELTDSTLRSARATIEHARELLRRFDRNPADHAG